MIEIDIIEHTCRTVHPLPTVVSPAGHEQTAVGWWGPTDIRTLIEPFRDYLPPSSSIVDLGCGDGRVLLLAAAMGYRATGIEADPRWYKAACIARREAAVPGALTIRLVLGDVFAEALSGYDAAYCYPGFGARGGELPSVWLRLDPGTIVIVKDYHQWCGGLTLLGNYPDGINVYRTPHQEDL